MSGQAARPGALRITSDGLGGRVHLDGRDISNALVAVNLKVGTGELPLAVLDLMIHDLTSEVEATFEVPDATRALLVRLGWTPPTEEATP